MNHSEPESRNYSLQGQFSVTSFGAGSQQVDDVEMRSQVAHDLQLRHEGLLLAAPGSGCSTGQGGE